MAYPNQNAKLKREVEVATGLNSLIGVPNQISESIIPMFEVNKKYIDVVESVNSSTTIYTTPANKDFYLVGCQITQSTGADNGPGVATITGYPKGQAIKTLCSNYIDTSVLITASNGTTSIIFPFPILMERSSIIAFSGGSSDQKRGHIYGYTEETGV
jgi:hypothetical protein